MIDSFSSAPLRRIAITGVGLVTPLGCTREESWAGILAGRRTVQWLDDQVPASSGHIPSARLFGARVPWEPVGPDRLTAFAVRAAREAILQAGLTSRLLREAACVIGTSKIDLHRCDDWQQSISVGSNPGSGVDVLFPSRAAMAVAQSLGCEAGAICPVAACATGLVSMIQAANLIRDGHCPIVIAGSADASLHAGLLASYRRLGVLARPGEDPACACRPFDRSRTGFAVGEGAGILILEDWEHARRRNAIILAEWVDGMLGSDPTSLTRIHPEGETLAEVTQRLLRRCRLSASDISAVSLHATATRLNDQAEAAALQQVFGNLSVPIPAFGIKGAIGHLMGAAGAVETAFCVMSLQQQTIPPTVNHAAPDAGLNALRLANHKTDVSGRRNILKISLGFGGTVAAGLLRKV